MTLRESKDAFARGASAQALLDKALEQIEADRAFGAWAFVDEHSARRAAAALDEARARGEAAGPLAGVFVGVKDNIHVQGMPKACGLAVAAPPAERDAPVVARLRQAGAIILGKTSMPECALGVTPGAKNPLDPARTPGSSSSGSAIAVARGHVGLALGTQTNASLIRPASFCGIAAWKPTYDAAALDGLVRLCPSLDVPGWMTARVDDLRLLPGCPVPAEADPAEACPPMAWVWPLGGVPDTAVRQAFDALRTSLGLEERALPDAAENSVEWLDTIMNRELADNAAGFFAHGLTPQPPLRAALEQGAAVLPAVFAQARRAAGALYDAVAKRLAPGSVLVSPAARECAPLLQDGAGSPLCSTLWSLCGMPCLTLPAFWLHGMPVGIQLVARRNEDGVLLRAATALAPQLEARQPAPQR